MGRTAFPIVLVVILLVSTIAIFSYSSLSRSSLFESGSRKNSPADARSQLVALGDNNDANVRHPPKGIRAELMHRDHDLRTNGYLSAKERAERDVKLSRQRAEELNSRGDLRLPNDGARRQLVDEFNARVSIAPGEYVMSISVGTPPQNFVAVIDTGSDLTWLQCSTCLNCFDQINRPFQARNSSTYSTLPCSDDACKLFLEQYNDNWVTSCNPAENDDLGKVGCQYSYFYADSSNTTGDFVSDTLNLQRLDGNLTKVPNFAFGCSRRSFSPTSLFEGSDGLVGLAQGSISFPAQIGSVYGDVFSYCLVSTGSSRSKTSTMYFGSEAAVFNVTGLQYTPLLENKDNPTFYYVGLEGMAVDGQQIDISKDWLKMNRSRGGVIFDSGTTLTIVERRAMDVLAKVVTQKMNYSRLIPSPVDGLEYCWNVRGEFLSDVKGPSISFNFTNANYDFAFENAYILAAEGRFQVLCLAMAAGSEPGTTTIIGNIQQRNFHVVYDRVQNRIGWAKKDCSSVDSLSFQKFLLFLIQTLAIAFIRL